MNKRHIVFFVFWFIFLENSQAKSAVESSINLEDFLKRVEIQHHGIQSLIRLEESSTYKKMGSDIDLVPVLTLKASKSDDKNPQTLGSYLLERSQVTEYSLGLAKKFSTGTQAQVLASLSENEIDGSSLSSGASTKVNQSYGRGALGLSFSQSLWKDFFGHSTRLKQERMLQIEQAEKQSFDLQKRQLLIEAESIFWNYLYAQEELSQRQDSLARSKKIENWVSRRVGNGIGDEADLLNARGLVATRELQLLTAQDELLVIEKQLRDSLELSDQEKTPRLVGQLKMQRGLSQMVSGRSNSKSIDESIVKSNENSRVVRLDYYLSELEAKIKQISANETDELYKPELTLEGQYRTNAQEANLKEAQNKITDSSKPTQAVALKFTWLFDTEVKRSATQMARAEALAAELKKERRIRESDSAWSEISRRHSELAKKAKAAELASDIQTKKAAAQRDKLSKGRAITADVIAAEQDAAEAQLLLTKLLVEQRKLEAQGRLFITIDK